LHTTPVTFGELGNVLEVKVLCPWSELNASEKCCSDT
uniref:Chorein_N domain-containing protein n=1 Tax=Haemonchus placei TaxID=6290 RepID=A0A0N4WY56_HAEPC